MPRYTPQQWIDDFDFVVRLQLQPRATSVSVVSQARAHFHEKYPEDHTDRFARFQQAMQFLDMHMDALSFGRAAVAADSEALVARPLVLALHEHYSSVPVANLNTQPSVQSIRELATKHGA